MIDLSRVRNKHFATCLNARINALKEREKKMSKFSKFLGKKLFLMSTFPLQEIRMEGYTKRVHFFNWIIGWLWAISGIFAGSLFALPLLNIIQIHGTTNETLASTFVAIT